MKVLRRYGQGSLDTPVVAIAIVFVVFLNATSSAVHADDHEDVPVNPAYKYSKAANKLDDIVEDEIIEDDIIDLPPSKPTQSRTHSHGHSHGGHGHSHGGHGHSHGGHGHSHGGHGHSHGPPQRQPTQEERERHRARLHKNWDDDDDEETHLGGVSVWMKAIGATLLISAAPFFILFLIPLDNSREKQWLLKIFLSFASGGLLGDAFLHLIPHAMMVQDGGHTHSHGHSHHGGDDGQGEHAHDMTVGLGVLSGIVAFLCVEKVVRIINGGVGGHGHSHAVKFPKKEARGESKSKEEKKDVKDDNEEQKKGDSKIKEKVKEVEKEIQSEIKVAGFLNLFADCFHNFTDGLAIGASFMAGESVGVVTTLTILLHEVPHEIGDYAILIQSGMDPMKAIMLQLLTALGALTGCLVSLIAQGGEMGSASTMLILPFTAGGFIYIATVSVIPDLLDGISTFKQSLLEIFALLSGVGMMVIIADFE